MLKKPWLKKIAVYLLRLRLITIKALIIAIAEKMGIMGEYM